MGWPGSLPVWGHISILSEAKDLAAEATMHSA
jgi:hypothetical protein